MKNNVTTTMNPLYAHPLVGYSDFRVVDDKICLLNHVLSEEQQQQFMDIIGKYSDYSRQQTDQELLLKDEQYMDLIYSIIKKDGN